MVTKTKIPIDISIGNQVFNEHFHIILEANSELLPSKGLAVRLQASIEMNGVTTDLADATLPFFLRRLAEIVEQQERKDNGS